MLPLLLNTVLNVTGNKMKGGLLLREDIGHIYSILHWQSYMAFCLLYNVYQMVDINEVIHHDICILICVDLPHLVMDSHRDLK